MTENDINIHIGEKIRLRRHVLGMNQTDLGQKIGVTFQQVQKYEKGYNKIVASKLFDLAIKMGVSINYFFDGLNTSNNYALSANEDSANFIHKNKKEDSSNRDVMMLVKLYNSITKKNTKKKLLLFLKTLANEEKN